MYFDDKFIIRSQEWVHEIDKKTREVVALARRLSFYYSTQRRMVPVSLLGRLPEALTTSASRKVRDYV